MAELQRFIPGDEVRIDVHFQHAANIGSIEVAFAHETAGGGVEFYELQRANPDVYRRKPGNLTTRHVAKMQGVITSEHFPGIYRCVSLAAVTAAGSRLAFSRLPNLTFEVLPEPGGKPELLNDTRFAEPDHEGGANFW